MKKKLILALILTVVFTCLFVIGVAAETPSMYIEFGARFPGSNEYITVYTENAESIGNPQINFATKKFYSDVDFTTEVDMSTATGIDFSVTKTYVNGAEGNPVTRMTKPSNPFVNCEEVKWFLAGMPTVSYNGSFFQNWTGLKSFDFGNATAINDNTFEGSGLESITIPAAITSIGGSAFKNCLSLKSVVIEGSVKKFNNATTFYGCTALESVDIGTPTYVGSSMFNGCISLKAITIPSTVTEISASAFQGCTNLTTISLPEVTSIGSSAFSGCTALASVNAPKVTSISSKAFYDCSALTQFTSTSALKSISDEAFKNCTTLTGTFDFSSMTTIRNSAFYNCPNLIIGDLNLASVTTLGGAVFYGNTSITSAIIPEGITEIGGSMFKNCTNLRSVKIPSTVTKFSGNAFENCSSLTNVEFTYNYEKYPEFGSAFTTIGNGSVFAKCTSLTTLVFPNSLTHVDNSAFSGCSSLQTLILGASFTTTNQCQAIPKTLTSLILSETYTSNGMLFAWDKDKFTCPTTLVIYYTGTLAQAEALQGINTYCWEVSHSTLVSYEEFTSEDFERDSNVHYMVYGYNKCTAFYNDAHKHGTEQEKFLGAEYLTDYVIATTCQRCNENVIKETIATSIFTNKGYSYASYGTGKSFTFGISLNEQAYSDYTAHNPDASIKFGFIIGSVESSDNDILNANGTSKLVNHVITDFTSVEYQKLNRYDLIIHGIGDDDVDTPLYCGAYVIEGDSIYYIGNTTTQKAVPITYSTLPVA